MYIEKSNLLNSDKLIAKLFKKNYFKISMKIVITSCGEFNFTRFCVEMSHVWQ